MNAVTLNAVTLNDIVAALDRELRTADIADYPGAVNGLQVTNSGLITRVAVAVDASLAAVSSAVALSADLLIVHHGLFWSGVQPITGTVYRKYAELLANNVAVYATHLPLDAHATLGNNVQLARALGLEPSSGFARYKTSDIGVAGSADLEAFALIERITTFAAHYGGTVRTSLSPAGRRVRAWAMCTGGGASSETLREARERGIDTLIVGEGPHHTTIDAQEHDILVIYAGHYATETLGVQAVGAFIASQFGIPWSFLHLPTGS